MNYTPNHQLFSSVFVLPSAIADEQLKLASGAQLKVILALYRSQNEPFDALNLSQKTGLSVGEVLDACAYWAEKGILLCDGAVQTNTSPTTSEVKTATAEIVEDEPPEGSPDDPNAPIVQTIVVESKDQNVEMFTGKELSDPTDAAMDAAKKAIIATEMAEKEKQEAKKQAREKITVSPTRPTHAQISKRIDECEELRDLFNEAQSVLGRMLGTGDQAALLLLFDYYGLPADVLLMLCEYARTMGKAGNLNYIYAVGQDWSEREIDTFERADEELRRLSQIDSNWTALRALTGLQHIKPTKTQQKYLRSWVEDWKFSIAMVALAYEKMQERTDGVRFSYMNGILKNWHAKGIKTPEQAAEEEQQFQEKKQTEQTEKKPYAKKQPPVADGVSAAVAKSGTAGTPASYDLDKAEKTARETVPTLRKRGKKN